MNRFLFFFRSRNFVASSNTDPRHVITRSNSVKFRFSNDFDITDQAEQSPVGCYQSARRIT